MGVYPGGGEVEGRLTQVLCLSSNVIEIITRLKNAHKAMATEELPLDIKDEFTVNIDKKGGTRLSVGRADAEALSVRKKGRSLDIAIPSTEFADPNDAAARGGTQRNRLSTMLDSEGET